MKDGMISDDVLFFPHKVIDILLANQDFVKALADSDVVEANSLINTQIFPRKKNIVFLTEESKFYVTMDASLSPADSNHYMGLKLVFYIFGHEDKAEMQLNGFTVDRATYLWLQLHKELSVSRDLGIGLLNFLGAIPLEVNDKYAGIKAAYSTVSFNL
jgi:hypothetical protein